MVRITLVTRAAPILVVFLLKSPGWLRKPLARRRAVLIIRGQVPTASCQMRRENFLPESELKWQTQF